MFKFIFCVFYLVHIFAALIDAYHHDMVMACYDMLWALMMYFWANEKE